MVEGGGFEPPKLARQIYSLIPLATREPLPQDPPRAEFPGSLTQERHFMGIEVLVQSFNRDFMPKSNMINQLVSQARVRSRRRIIKRSCLGPSFTPPN